MFLDIFKELWGYIDFVRHGPALIVAGSSHAKA
jgi:hypothetical protein